MMFPVKVFKSVAVSGTNVYKSLVCTPGEGEIFYYQATLGSTATGVLKGQVNNLPRPEYEAAVLAAAGSTREEKEAANDVGWVDESFQRSSAKNAAATANLNGASAPNVTLHVDPGPARHRLVYTNATNTGPLVAYRTNH